MLFCRLRCTRVKMWLVTPGSQTIYHSKSQGAARRTLPVFSPTKTPSRPWHPVIFWKIMIGVVNQLPMHDIWVPLPLWELGKVPLLKVYLLVSYMSVSMCRVGTANPRRCGCPKLATGYTNGNWKQGFTSKNPTKLKGAVRVEGTFPKTCHAKVIGCNAPFLL